MDKKSTILEQEIMVAKKRANKLQLIIFQLGRTDEINGRSLFRLAKQFAVECLLPKTTYIYIYSIG